MARQLLQLSSETNDRRDGYDNSCAEAEQRRRGDATDESSTNNEVGENSEDQEEDRIRWPDKRKFRSVYHLYRSTKPVAVVRAKRRKCTVRLLSYEADLNGYVRN